MPWTEQNKSYQPAAPCCKNFVFQLWGQSCPSHVLNSLTKCVFLTRVALGDLRSSNPLIQKDDEVFEKFPVLHILWEAAGLLTHYPDREVTLGRLGRPPHLCWAPSLLLTQLMAQRQHIRASLDTLSVLLTEDSENRHINCLCFSRGPGKICARLYFLLTERKQIFPGLVARAFVIMHKARDRSNFHLDGLARCSLVWFFSKGRKGPDSPQSL